MDADTRNTEEKRDTLNAGQNDKDTKLQMQLNAGHCFYGGTLDHYKYDDTHRSLNFLSYQNLEKKYTLLFVIAYT